MAREERSESKSACAPDLTLSGKPLHVLLESEPLFELLHPTLPCSQSVFPPPFLNLLLVVTRKASTFLLEFVFLSIGRNRLGALFVMKEGRNILPGRCRGGNVLPRLSRGVKRDSGVRGALFAAIAGTRPRATRGVLVRVHPSSCANCRCHEGSAIEVGGADRFNGVFIRDLVLHVDAG